MPWVRRILLGTLLGIISCLSGRNTLPGTPIDEAHLTNGPKKLGVRNDE